MYNSRNLLALLVFTALKNTGNAFAPTGRLVSHRLVTENVYSVETAKKSNLIRAATDVSADVPEPEKQSFLQKVSTTKNYNLIVFILLKCKGNRINQLIAFVVKRLKT